MPSVAKLILRPGRESHQRKERRMRNEKMAIHRKAELRGVIEAAGLYQAAHAGGNRPRPIRPVKSGDPEKAQSTTGRTERVDDGGPWWYIQR